MELVRYVGFGICNPTAQQGTIADGLATSWPYLLLVLSGVAVIVAARSIQSKPLRYGVMALFVVFTLIALLVAMFFYQLGATCQPIQ